ncbi:MAG TPA: hypothetical protein VF599_04695 [Pyrinomonadaceae bacterium]|jgi:hypothetical protein
MINKGKTTTTTEDLMIQGLLGNYLRFRSANQNLNDVKHLDDDSLSAFVEGNLSERESTPILSHLVDCSFCRHVTAELVRLDFAFAGEETPMPVAENAPTSVSDVLNNLLSRIFGTSDSSAVLAHQQPEEKEEAEEDEKKS